MARIIDGDIAEPLPMTNDRRMIKPDCDRLRGKAIIKGKPVGRGRGCKRRRKERQKGRRRSKRKAARENSRNRFPGAKVNYVLTGDFSKYVFSKVSACIVIDCFFCIAVTFFYKISSREG